MLLAKPNGIPRVMKASQCSRFFSSSILLRSNQVPALNRPIGSKYTPSPSDNTGLDDRTFKEKYQDMKDPEKHKKRRKELLEEMSHSAFEPLKDFRDSGGKLWTSPKSFFKKEMALYMPNFYGYTLASSSPSGTTSVLKGKISVVRLFTSYPGEKQTQSYFPSGLNDTKEDGFQIVSINLPENAVKEFFVKAFLGNMRRTTAPKQHPRYFICRKGVTPALRALIAAKNIYPGYIYLVDADCKIRWAACGEATPEDVSSLWRYVNSLKQESLKRDQD